MLDKFIVGELPDYKNKLEKIEFKNSKIKIGIIGMIDSSIKGIDILKLLFNKYKNSILIVLDYSNKSNSALIMKDLPRNI